MPGGNLDNFDFDQAPEEEETESRELGVPDLQESMFRQQILEFVKERLVTMPVGGSIEIIRNDPSKPTGDAPKGLYTVRLKEPIQDE